MPISRIRRKSVYTPPQEKRQAVHVGNPRWLVPLMLAAFILGLLWIVVYYVAGDRIPFMVSLGAWNFAIGFGAMAAGIVMSMRWR